MTKNLVKIWNLVFGKKWEPFNIRVGYCNTVTMVNATTCN